MSFGYIKSAPKGVHPDDREKAMELARPLTPQSEMGYNERGVLGSSVQVVPGLCYKGAKCIRRANHTDACWPLDSH